MPTFARITATFAGGPNEPPDIDYKIILNAAVQDQVLVKAEFFGKVIEADEGAWPFILEPPAGPDGIGRINYGPGYNGDRERINIFGKTIQPGILFTRWAYDEEEWTYRITAVHMM